MTQDALDGRVAVIVGASSGIGAATARRLAQEGMHVALGARREKKLAQLAQQIESEHGTQAVHQAVDVTSMEQVRGFADTVRDAFGGVDLLFANAGRPGRGTVDELEEATFEDTIDVNLNGAFRTAKTFLPLIREREGTRTVVFTASVAGKIPMPASSAYSASKHGLRGFARSLAQEVADEGIRVTALNPGFVNTPWHAEDPRSDEMIQPEDLAEIVVTLATMNETALLDDVTVWPAKMY